MTSLLHLAHIAHRNKDKIIEHFRYKSNETFSEPNKTTMTTDDKKLLGMAIGVFITILVIAIVFWIVAFVLLAKYWDQLTDSAKIIGVIGILPFMPLGSLFTILAVIIGRKN